MACQPTESVVVGTKDRLAERVEQQSIPIGTDGSESCSTVAQYSKVQYVRGHTILNQVTYKLAFVIYIRVSDEAVQWKNTQSVSVTLSVFILLRVVHDNDGYCPPVSTKIT